MITYCKSFEELSLSELHEILRLRSEVFVVEQACIYQDIDGKDPESLHVLGFENDTLVAYTRIIKPGHHKDSVVIGRVVVRNTARSKGYAYAIMEAAMHAIKDHFPTDSISLSAQTYLKSFYNKLGFKEIGDEYLEDGIPHILMVKDQ